MHTLAAIADALGARLKGDGAIQVRGIAPLNRATADQISFLTHPRYRPWLATTRAAAVILDAKDADHCPVAALIDDRPQLLYARVAALFKEPVANLQGIHPSAWVSDEAHVAPDAWVGPLSVVEAGAQLAAGVFVGPRCVVGADCVVGAHSKLLASVTLAAKVRLGERVVVQPGAVIGSEGFGYAWTGQRWVNIPQLGGVTIGDDVDIGANTTIDRGSLDDTIIEAGVKLDNLIQVAHNVHIKAHTAMAACVGISGSVVVGERCRIAGGVGIAGHLHIADDVVITGMSLVSKSLRAKGVYSSGVPVTPNRLWNRITAHLRRLDALARRLKALERLVGVDKTDKNRG
ncbi:MAG: UDP-3-O-(3-hydroxymyristoyl)glucosamine N-acyltransferase [Candidatus Competibacterales bacterium]